MSFSNSKSYRFKDMRRSYGNGPGEHVAPSSFDHAARVKSPKPSALTTIDRATTFVTCGNLEIYGCHRRPSMSTPGPGLYYSEAQSVLNNGNTNINLNKNPLNHSTPPVAATFAFKSKTSRISPTKKASDRLTEPVSTFNTGTSHHSLLKNNNIGFGHGGKDGDRCTWMCDSMALTRPTASYDSLIYNNNVDNLSSFVGRRSVSTPPLIGPGSYYDPTSPAVSDFNQSAPVSLKKPSVSFGRSASPTKESKKSLFQDGRDSYIRKYPSPGPGVYDPSTCLASALIVKKHATMGSSNEHMAYSYRPTSPVNDKIQQIMATRSLSPSPGNYSLPSSFARAASPNEKEYSFQKRIREFGDAFELINSFVPKSLGPKEKNDGHASQTPTRITSTTHNNNKEKKSSVSKTELKLSELPLPMTKSPEPNKPLTVSKLTSSPVKKKNIIKPTAPPVIAS